MKTTSIAVLSLVLAAACSAPRTNEAAAQARAPIHHPEYGLISAQPVEGWDVFGADVPEGKAMSVKTLLASAETYRGQEVLVEAPIQAVCLKKGCWMTFDGNGKQVRVKFKDYAFFMPKDSDGRVALVHAKFEVKEMSAEQIAHYLEDEGKHEEAKNVTEGVTEYTLYASGVRLRQ